MSLLLEIAAHERSSLLCVKELQKQETSIAEACSDLLPSSNNSYGITYKSKSCCTLRPSSTFIGIARAFDIVGESGI